MQGQIRQVDIKFKQSLVGNINLTSMTLITIDSIGIKNNPAMFTSPINFQITFTSLAPLPYPLQWKLIYVGSALSEQYDQILEQFQIGPFQQASTMKFQVECNPPDHNKIPFDQLLSVTALILTVSYRNQQFIRVGYYVHNQFICEDELDQKSYPILPILITATKRTIIADKPRITHFTINWKQEQLAKQSNEGSDHEQLKSIIGQQKEQRNVIGTNDRLSTQSYSLHSIFDKINQQ